MKFIDAYTIKCNSEWVYGTFLGRNRGIDAHFLNEVLKTLKTCRLKIQSYSTDFSLPLNSVLFQIAIKNHSTNQALMFPFIQQPQKLLRLQKINIHRNGIQTYENKRLFVPRSAFYENKHIKISYQIKITETKHKHMFVLYFSR